MKWCEKIAFFIVVIGLGITLHADKDRVTQANKLGYTYTSRLIVPDELKDFDLMEGVEQEFKESYPKEYKDFAPIIDNAQLVPLYLKKINEQVGYGVFAAEDLPEGTVIGEYTGVLYHETRNNKLQDTRYAWGLDDPRPGNLIIDARTHGNELRFVNHSRNPNVSVEYFPYKSWWHVLYIANKQIKKDEQLLVDYGFWYGHNCKMVDLEP